MQAKLRLQEDTRRNNRRLTCASVCKDKKSRRLTPGGGEETEDKDPGWDQLVSVEVRKRSEMPTGKNQQSLGDDANPI